MTAILVWRGRDVPSHIGALSEDWDDVEWAVLFPVGFLSADEPIPHWVQVMDIAGDPDVKRLPDGRVLCLAIQ